jgi:two-component system, sensor histidine kinase
VKPTGSSDVALPADAPPDLVVAAAGASRTVRGLAAVLVLVFLGVGWLQWQSMALLNGTVQYQGDNTVWSFYQLESEYQRLLGEMQELSHHPTPALADSARERYEVFVSRISLVEPERTHAVLPDLPMQLAVLDQVKAFVAAADPLIGPDVPTTLDTAVWSQLEYKLKPLQEPIRALGLQANQIVAEQVGRRNDAVRSQNRVAIGLTIFQSLLTLAFAVVVARQLGALQLRRAHLETLAQRLQEARLEAEQASRAKSAFLANMSHELRTPFNGLLGMLSLLERSRLDAQQADQLQTARESGEHLLAILNDVLDISKLESGRLEFDPAPTSLMRLLGDVRSVMSPQAQAKCLGWDVTLADDLPRWVLADAKRVKQVLFNLVGNALKFTAQGAVTLHVERVPPEATGLTGDAAPVAVRFHVTDTGIGMDAPTLARLFQRFSQGDETINRRYGGTGLGLEISRTLARMMGGDITVRSHVGAGSVFTLSLPLEPVAAPQELPLGGAELAPQQAAVLAGVAGAAGAAGLADAAPGALTDAPPADGALRVLVTDDHPVNRKFMLALLSQLGHAVVLCENGAEAVVAVQSGGFDLVLMDVHMPVMDGLAATRAIRALSGPVAGVRIVALTADAFSESRERVAAAGMDDFLAKPVQLPDVEELLRRHFGARAVGVRPSVAVAPSAVPSAVPKPTAPRRRFKRGDAGRVLDLDAIGEVCIAVSLSGYGGLLSGFLADESRTYAELVEALAPGATQRRPAAHKVKGAAANLGLRLLAQTAREIEQAEGAVDADTLAVWAARLDEEWLLTRALCERMGWLTA